ncbi:hypothetical protein L3X38_026550 [Prunus dulcis]|uniref:Uncharacterized protein n=1 Tax=Prunus dulcis TaxID=3755 RepID=A0AAD4VMR1_PRUDU|nr:hypothetical protein L3X38_026550 [Prunus dulcis]
MEAHIQNFSSKWKNTKKEAEYLAAYFCLNYWIEHDIIKVLDVNFNALMNFKIECGKLQEDIETLQDQVMDLELEIGMLTQDENLEENGIDQPQSIVNISDMEEE